MHAQNPDQADWTSDQAMRLYFEAFTHIKKKALSQPTAQSIVHESLKAYLQHIDPYAEFLAPDEYQAFKRSQKSDYVGVGMRIERDASGQIRCYPFSQGPAAKAGVASGDILKAIGGFDIGAKSLFAIGAMIGGQAGTPVVLILQAPDGELKTISITREEMSWDSVQALKIDHLEVVKIDFFRSGAQRELKHLIANPKHSQPLIFDLRGNGGGDLNEAIDCAMLFLKKNQKIVDIQKPHATQSYQSFGDTVNADDPVYIWQDQRTASAAEVFIAALTQNHRALSIGQPTYGKGTTQDIIELSDGSAMFLTTGYLYPPDGKSYHQKGLAPDYPLDASDPLTKDFVSQTKRLIKSGTHSRPQALDGANPVGRFIASPARFNPYPDYLANPLLTRWPPIAFQIKFLGLTGGHQEIFIHNFIYLYRDAHPTSNYNSFH